jgi:hypothetical protein
VARSKHRDGEAMRRLAGRPRAFRFYSTLAQNFERHLIFMGHVTSYSNPAPA